MRAYKALLQDDKGYYTNGGKESKRIDWQVGKRVTVEGELKLCENGIHFFRHLAFAIDYLAAENAISEVEVHGNIVEDTEKACTNDIEIVRIIPVEEIKAQIDDKNNTGKNCTGARNSGARNSGDGNSGDRNSGSWNSGYGNSGCGNSGCGNSGCGNSGDGNSGDGNSGYGNSGNWNSGNWNSGNWNSGNRNSGDGNSGNGYRNFFCTQTRFFIFDVEVESIPDNIKYLDMSWFDLNGKTYQEAWESCPSNVLDAIRSIPQFNKAKFYEITGIEL